MGLFKKGKSRDEIIAEAAEIQSAGDEKESKKDDSFDSGNPKVDMEITRIKAQLESFSEIRKANADRFARISEQIGELRGMITDITKAMGRVEVGATKAVDLVESVHPEKLMVEVRKQDGKIEALKASLDAQTAIINDFKNEMKEFRQKMNFYKGVEQVAHLNNEVKDELAEIKKVEAVIERHSDKIEGIFLDVEKKFANFQKYDDITKDLQKSFQRIETDFDKLRIAVEKRALKQDFVKLLDKFNDFEKHTGSVLKLLDERSKSLKTDLDASFKRLRKKLERAVGTSLQDSSDDQNAPANEGAKKGFFSTLFSRRGKNKGEASEKKTDGQSAEANAGQDAAKGGDAGETAAKADKAPSKKEERVIVEKPLDEAGTTDAGTPSQETSTSEESQSSAEEASSEGKEKEHGKGKKK
ncbi:hypothetical protein D6783_01505 [Candidatus Woesearchaeota archaeon]|nr:MAG: hypothetical protein D6783_01505 [Candidatus Woesearchaeota archaeon]